MYTLNMKDVGIAEARRNFAALVERAQDEPVGITRHGEQQAVIVSSVVFDRMQTAYEEFVDAAAFDAAMQEEGENLPWDEVKRELGWT